MDAHPPGAVMHRKPLHCLIDFFILPGALCDSFATFPLFACPLPAGWLAGEAHMNSEATWSWHIAHEEMRK